MVLSIEGGDERSLESGDSMSKVRASSWARNQVEYEQSVRIRSSVKHQPGFSENVLSKSEARVEQQNSCCRVEVTKNRTNAGCTIALSPFVAPVSGESRLGKYVNCLDSCQRRYVTIKLPQDFENQVQTDKRRRATAYPLDIRKTSSLVDGV